MSAARNTVGDSQHWPAGEDGLGGCGVMRIGATALPDYDAVENGPPGGFTFLPNQDGEPDQCLLHKCPCGCGRVAGLRIGRVKPTQSPSWEWDGNREKPTLSPSVYAKYDCGWHGYLKAGIWESC